MSPEGAALRRGALASVARIASPALLGMTPADLAMMEQAGAQVRGTLKTAELDIVWNHDAQSCFLAGVSMALETLLAHFTEEPHETAEETLSCLQRSAGFVAADALIASGVRWGVGPREEAAGAAAKWQTELAAEHELAERLDGPEVTS